MKKYRITKKWPGGPEVGKEMVADYTEKFVTVFSREEREMARVLPNGSYYYVDEIEGFVEEVKEPEEFWFMDEMGDICSGRDDLPGSHDDWKSSIPDWLRFKTKEACEKFRDGLIATHGERSVIGAGTTPNVHCLVNALNQRVAK